MTDTPTSIVTFRPSENVELSNTFMSLESQLERAARQNLENALRNVGQSLASYTETEQMAMIKTEALRGVGGMELAAVLLRGKMLREIEDQGLWSRHPNGYHNLQELAEDQGISLSELTDTRAMVDVIFPWIEQNLTDADGRPIPIAIIWEKVGKSKFRALVPVLKSLITGEMPERGTARNTVQRIMDDTAASLRTANPNGEISDDTIRHQAVEDLMVAGEQMTARELRDHVRDGEPTPALEPTLIVVDGRTFMLAEIDDPETLTVVGRKLGRHMAQPQRVQAVDNRRARRQQLLAVQVVRDLFETFD